jgi:hypothetical protein
MAESFKVLFHFLRHILIAAVLFMAVTGFPTKFG